MHNKAILVGRLGKEPEIRFTQDQKPIATLSIATTDYRHDGSTGKATAYTEWHRVVLFGKLAEVVQKRKPKTGLTVLVEGPLRTRKWQDSANVERYTTEIVADVYTELGSNADKTANAPENQEK